MFRWMIVIIVLLGLTASQAWAELPSPFRGAFVFMGGKKEQKKVKDAIDAATSNIPFFYRKQARRNIWSGNAPPKKIAFIAQKEKVSIERGRSWKRASRLNGPPVKVKTPTGLVLTVVRRLDANTIIETISGRSLGFQVKRINQYHLSNDGKKLSFDVTIYNFFLRHPLRYSLTYQRGP